MTSPARSPASGSRPKSPWLPFGTPGEAPVRLLCLPHAGAGASIYRTWGLGLPPSIAACPVQPPGREKRRSEPPLTSARELVTQLAPEIIRAVRPPYAIFGHSMGALCAFELTREIRRLGGHLPVRLFLSGRRAPQQAMTQTELAGLSVQALAEVLRELGGTPEAVLASPAMLRLVQPLMAADFHVNEAYCYRAEPRLPVPITTFGGTEDAGARPDDMAGWHAETSAGHRMVVLPGNHFAIFDHATAVIEEIAVDLRQWL
jgi:medium-chain acyl-[acyl-carrier-protein] hydrolase